MAHFRINIRPVLLAIQQSNLAFSVGTGLAELQDGEDDLGFKFKNPEGTSVAGPEWRTAASWIRPLGAGLELLLVGDVGLAWLPGAPDLLNPHSEFQPFAGITLGLGW